MGYVTKDQIARSKEISVLEYVERYEMDRFKRVGSSYRMREHPSLAVNDKGYYWHSNDVGGVTALDYLIKVHGYGFVEAVCHLINESPYEKGQNTQNAQRSRPPPRNYVPKPMPKATKTLPPDKVTPQNHKHLVLPRRNKDNFHSRAYLLNRGIDHDTIMDCISRGTLYEQAMRKNVVFLGKDENGKTRFAHMRSLVNDFKCDAEGSDKRFGFVMPPSNLRSRKVAVFESPIDCMSHQTLSKRGDIQPFDGWRLSLGGMSIEALKQFLIQHPSVDYCVICTDNDEAGNKAALRIAEEIHITSERLLPAHGKDWNDCLVATLKMERQQEKEFHMQDKGLHTQENGFYT